jgi:hypothetical protein
MNQDYDSVLVKSYYLTDEYGRVRDVCAASDGSLYFIARDRDKAHIRVIRNPLFNKIEEKYSDNIFSVYPNPTSGLLNYQILSGSIGILSLYDINGKKLFTKKLDEPSGKIDISKFSTGSYFITLRFPDGSIERKLIVIN